MPQRIEDYGIVGDLHTAALVGRDGSDDWLCLPNIDSPACFAALLGDESHGAWRLAPASGGPCTTRAYRDGSLVLDTEWETPEGRVRVTDLMPPRDSAPGLVRIVEGLSGRVPVVSDLRLRLDYGRSVPWVTRSHGTVRTVAGPHAITLTTPVAVEVEEGATGDLRSRFEVTAGDRVPFVLTHHDSYRRQTEPARADDALASTLAFWQAWSAGTRYDGRWPDAVRRSLVTLKALTFAPTGGIAAAATTSLPEQLGGERNWDYRYCWLRDASFTLLALLGTGHVAEARAWREWLLRAVAGSPADLQIMYGLDGRRRLPEEELGWLPGYAGSRPVRVGNGAADQLQLDVWGEVLLCLDLARGARLGPHGDTWRLEQGLMDFLEGHWDDLDNGLWEVRGPRRAFVHSRVMAWAGVDRAVRAVERYGLDGPVDAWRSLRATIREDILTRGYDARRNTFTQCYGSTGLDASLLLPRVGFLPWDDPRVVGTIEAVQRELTQDGLLLRYGSDTDDGLGGAEGTFLVCSFWMSAALDGIGRRDEAVALFERLLSLRNDLGLLSEEYDVAAGRQLGNVPQAFSHVGLVNTARVLSDGILADDWSMPADDA